MTRSRRKPAWRRWLLALIGIAVLFLAPALARSDIAARSANDFGAAASGQRETGSPGSCRLGPACRFR
jgi:hypothetical protein